MNCSTCGTLCSHKDVKSNRNNAFIMENNSINSSKSLTEQWRSPANVFPKQTIQNLGAQPILSKEHLSMKNSEEVFNACTNTQESYDKVGTHDFLAIETNSRKGESCMNVLFLGAKTAENAVLPGGQSENLDIKNSYKADELSKHENVMTFDNSTREYKNVKRENMDLIKEVDTRNLIEKLKGSAVSVGVAVNGGDMIKIKIELDNISLSDWQYEAASYENSIHSNIINTSEIRFIISTESLRNFPTNSEAHAPPTTSNKNAEQQISLSAEALQVFDSQNSANSREIVNNYLQNYGSSIAHHSTPLNCQHECCHLSQQPQEHNLEMTMKTVSVSTESEPKLTSTYLDRPAENMEAKLKSHNYSIMQATRRVSPVQSANMIWDKDDNKPSKGMCNRMQKILETFTEDTKISKAFEKSHLIKIPTQIPANQPAKEQVMKSSYTKEDKTADLVAQVVNAHRCFYDPPYPIVAPAGVQQEPPLPQFQTVPCSSALAQELLAKQKKFSNSKPVPAYLLNIPRSPIQCPEPTCHRMQFISDFNKHLVVDHNLLPMEHIAPFQCKNFFLDAHLFQYGATKCNLLYLMRDKIVNLGSNDYKDFLPVLVMTGRISLNQMCDLSFPTSSVDYFLVWVTGIAPEELSLSVSLTVWSRSGRVPSYHAVYSGQMYSIRNDQSPINVWRSGHTLLLSSQEVDDLTANGKDMINCQLCVH